MEEISPRNNYGRAKPPYEVQCFTWLVAQEVCLTQHNLQRRAVLCNRSVMCEEGYEDSSHLFIHWKVTQQLWSILLNLLEITGFLLGNTKELLCWNREGLNKDTRAIWNTVAAAIWRVIWRERNQRIFQGKKENKMKIFFFLISGEHNEDQIQVYL